jgi:4-hydroxyacetophenone monooxygenase
VAKLTPDCPIFSKRIVFDSGWFEMFNRPNVELVTSPIERITRDAIVTRDGAVHPVDVIAFATGFEIARMLGPLQVRGRGGRSLNEEWGEDDPRAHLGISVPGYPNFFFTTGPNSAPNHAAGVNLISETQIHYIVECLDRVVAEKAATFETTQAAYAEWNAEIDRRMPQMIWTHPKANSYYNNRKGRVFLSLPYRLVDYWTLTRAPAPGSYVLGPRKV